MHNLLENIASVMSIILFCGLVIVSVMYIFYTWSQTTLRNIVLTHFIPLGLFIWGPVYEFCVRLYCTGECNIRVDWVIILPLMALIWVLYITKLLVYAFKAPK